MKAQDATSAAGPALESACRSVQKAHDTIADQSLSPEAAHTAVAGVYELADAVAGMVNLLQNQLPAAVAAADAQTETVANELQADLRSLHGCITTGMRLLEPALDDLRGLSPSSS